MTPHRSVAVLSVRVVAATITTIATAGVALLAIAFLPTLVGYQAHVVSSGSMGSAAPMGSVVQTRMMPVQDVRVWDIVSFRHPSARLSVTHRVLKVEPGVNGITLTTKGDANATQDAEPIVVRGSIARVEHVIPWAGFIAGFARSPMGWGLLIVAPIAGMLRDARRTGRRTTHPREVASPA